MTTQCEVWLSSSAGVAGGGNQGRAKDSVEGTAGRVYGIVTVARVARLENDSGLLINWPGGRGGNWAEGDFDFGSAAGG